MAQPITHQTMDETLPLTCIIENSQLVEGHGEYSIRVTRASNDPSRSWTITKRFREFDDLNNILKEFGYGFELPKKKILGNTDRIFIAERQKGLQTYLDIIVQQLELRNSLIIQRFLGPDNHITNYSELALQYTSMFLRSANNRYNINEQLPDFGWRSTKTYFLATKTSGSKDDRYLITWCQYGLDKAFGEKDITNCLKLLKPIVHPLIVPIDEVYANENGVLIVCRFYSNGSLKDHLHGTKPTNGPYLKRYGPKSSSCRFNVDQIKTYGRQILEALNFLYDNGLVYGHLHSGNIFFDPKQSSPIKLLDLANVIAGVSSKYRGYISNIKQIRTFEQCDVYAFGRVLYELSTGEECSTGTCVQLPNTVPIPVQHVLLKIFAPTGDLPTIQQLLEDSFFQTTTSNNIERFQLKLSSKAKEAFEQISRTAQERLENDQAKIKNAQRRAKSVVSEEDKLKRRREKQAKAIGYNSDPNMSPKAVSKTLQRSVTVDPLQLSTGQTSPRRPLTPSMTVDIPNTSQASPSPPPPIAATARPPAPPPPPRRSAPPPAAASDDRNHLLSSITDFSHAKLKKAKTNDRSAPKFK